MTKYLFVMDYEREKVFRYVLKPKANTVREFNKLLAKGVHTEEAIHWMASEIGTVETKDL